MINQVPSSVALFAMKAEQDKAAFEGWCDGYALDAEPNYSEATKEDCKAAYFAGLKRGRYEGQYIFGKPLGAVD